MYKKMPMYDEAYKIVKMIPDFYMEMSIEEAGVLCGLIKEYRPKKILEIGIAAGGSTCNILKTLELTGLTDTKVISLDLNEFFYRTKEKETGYLLKENREWFSNYDNHTFLTSKLAVDRLEEIGNGIDLLFLDTVHEIPGEILDFLLLFPYLSPNAVVVLHDTNLHNMRLHNTNSIVTRVLINVVKGTKFFNPEEKFLNIGAFQVNQDTLATIEDVFASLLLPWGYSVPDDILNKYRAEYERHYSKETMAIWDNVEEVSTRRRMYMDIIRRMECAMKSGKKTYIYGCGFCGRNVRRLLKNRNYSLDGMVVSDGIELQQFGDLIEAGEKIYHFSALPVKQEECIIILGTVVPEVKKVLEDNKYNYIDIPEDFFWFIN